MHTSKLLIVEQFHKEKLTAKEATFELFTSPDNYMSVIRVLCDSIKYRWNISEIAQRLEFII